MTKCNVTQENKQKREEWLKNQEVTYIPIGSIKLVEDIHIKASVDFSKQVEKLRAKGITMLNNPIIVKREGICEYSLVTGYKGLCIALALCHTFIPAVVIDKNRKEFIEEVGFKKNKYRYLNIKSVIIPNKFRQYRVGKHKVNKCLEYYKKHSKMDKPVLLKGRKCVDGYSRLVASKILGLNKVFCKFV